MAELGRPTDYTPETVAKIIDGITQGLSMRSVCLPEEMPGPSTVFAWLAKYPDFADKYARAKEESVEAMAEDMLDISDEGKNDWMERTNQNGQNIGWMVNGEAVQRSKLRVDTRRWLMAKYKAKKYGDKIDHTTNGKDLPTPILGVVNAKSYVPTNVSYPEDHADVEAPAGSPGGHVGEQDRVDPPLFDQLGAAGPGTTTDEHHL